MSDNVVLIVGGAGYVGRALADYYSNALVVVYSRDEAKHLSFSRKFPNAEIAVGDVRDVSRLSSTVKYYKPNIVITASALKQVPVCESEPYESVKTNIIGTHNVISAVDGIADTCLFISSDKACSPINVYGMCKSVSERMMFAASAHSSKTKFLSVRYGNVLNSTGSVIPVFGDLATKGRNLPITDYRMTRFFMYVKDSAKLIDYAITYGCSGNVYIPPLKSFYIRDLASLFVDKYGVSIVESSIRPGEKVHECLVSEEEAIHTYDVDKYMTIASNSEGSVSCRCAGGYYSNNHLISKQELFDVVSDII